MNRSIPWFDKAKAVEVTLDKPRLLYFDIGRAGELERAAGSSILGLVSDEHTAMNTMSSMWFAPLAYSIGLQADDPGITKQRVSEIIQGLLEDCETPEEHTQLMLGLSNKVFEALRNCGALPRDKTQAKDSKDPKGGKGKGKPPEGQSK